MTYEDTSKGFMKTVPFELILDMNIKYQGDRKIMRAVERMMMMMMP